MKGEKTIPCCERSGCVAANRVIGIIMIVTSLALFSVFWAALGMNIDGEYGDKDIGDIADSTWGAMAAGSAVVGGGVLGFTKNTCGGRSLCVLYFGLYAIFSFFIPFIIVMYLELDVKELMQSTVFSFEGNATVDIWQDGEMLADDVKLDFDAEGDFTYELDGGNEILFDKDADGDVTYAFKTEAGQTAFMSEHVANGKLVPDTRRLAEAEPLPQNRITSQCLTGLGAVLLLAVFYAMFKIHKQRRRQWRTYPESTR